jgi:site-specific recombinase XerD
MKGKRDLALLAIPVACGLRRHEAVELNVSDLQQREDRWAIVDLIGKLLTFERSRCRTG